MAEFDHDDEACRQDTVMHAMAHGEGEKARRLQEDSKRPDGETKRLPRGERLVRAQWGSRSVIAWSRTIAG